MMMHLIVNARHSLGAPALPHDPLTPWATVRNLPASSLRSSSNSSSTNAHPNVMINIYKYGEVRSVRMDKEHATALQTKSMAAFPSRAAAATQWLFQVLSHSHLRDHSNIGNSHHQTFPNFTSSSRSIYLW
jgi:hypothetical protein